MSITMICGKPRKGKTALETYLLVQKMISDSHEDYVCAKREIVELKNGGYVKLAPPPQKHLCYSDYLVKVNSRLQAFYIDGFKLGLPNPFFETTFIPPYSTIFLDEAQRYYNSRMSKWLREEVYGWFQLHGQNHYNIYLACQRVANIDLNIRALADRIIIIEDLKLKKDKYGRVCGLTWFTREFNSAETAEEYQLACEKKEISSLGTSETYKTDFPIFNFYDSFSNKPVFFDGQENRPFDYYKEDGYEFTLESFIKYNNNHFYSAPQGYWKNSDYDKKIIESLEKRYGN